MTTPTIDQYLDRVAAFFEARDIRLATAESCTGGLLAAACSSHPGSSRWFEGGFVTYRLSAKTRMLGLSPVELQRHGAVSKHTATRMAAQALAQTDAQISMATTGLAGPEGDGTDTPVGTLWLAWAGLDDGGGVATECFTVHRDRDEFRTSAVQVALHGLLQRLPT